MITESSIYWITRLDGILNFFTVIAIIAFVAVFALFIFTMLMSFSAEEFWDTIKEQKKLFISLGMTFIMSCSVLVLVPSTKEMCAIKVIPKIANNSHIENLATDMVKIAESWVKSQLEEKK